MRAYQTSTLMMLGMPYLILTVAGVQIYRLVKKQEALQRQQHPEATAAANP